MQFANTTILPLVLLAGVLNLISVEGAGRIFRVDHPSHMASAVKR
ncbi:hypothetical protein PSTT_05363 [Puccinia striiformis]|uniref:Uncharacterized protein n=1 Tax=Puccinia striiformis TaxID=27350 RepID=A0A2S4VPA3_9BASI|nr:hypothetical protein PSTT_05363 [Puccinia striiformis]